MKKLFKYILIGALALIPLFVVIQIIFWVNKFTIELFNFVSSYTNSPLYTVLVFVFTLLILIFIGYTTEKAGKSFIVSTIDKILTKVPAIGDIYSIIKKITALFTPNSKDNKKEVVLVEYPKKDTWVPAYILNQYDSILVLFVPTSPNPTSGYTVMIDEEKVLKTTLTIAEASQFIISMGADFVKKEEITKLIKRQND
jgi:uncharacterized membrane protein